MNWDPIRRYALGAFLVLLGIAFIVGVLALSNWHYT